MVSRGFLQDGITYRNPLPRSYLAVGLLSLLFGANENTRNMATFFRSCRTRSILKTIFLGLMLPRPSSRCFDTVCHGFHSKDEWWASFKLSCRQGIDFSNILQLLNQFSLNKTVYACLGNKPKKFFIYF